MAIQHFFIAVLFSICFFAGYKYGEHNNREKYMVNITLKSLDISSINK